MGHLKYANRKSIGPKLGSAVKRDIIRKIPKLSERDKKAGAISRDISIELDVSTRDLGEDGIALVCEGLVEAAEAGLKIEDLNFSGNQLTVTSLLHVTKLLEMGPQIISLDLSNNNITITNEEEMIAWDQFLRGFRFCQCMRRLDLSGNPLTDYGIEVFLRVYASEPPIRLPFSKDGLGIISNFEEPESFTEIEGKEIKEQLSPQTTSHGTIKARSKKDVTIRNVSGATIDSTVSSLATDTFSTSDTSSRSSLSVEIHGLRGIPYIILCNVNMTDLSALWLSYLLPYHPHPEEITSRSFPLKDGPLSILLKRYDTVQQCNGIIWIRNPQLSPTGLRVLEIAEATRTNDVEKLEEILEVGVSRRRRSSSSFSHSGSIRRTVRKDSLRGGEIEHTTPQSHSSQIFLSGAITSLGTTNELDRNRIKIQAAAIRERGVGAAFLWKRLLRLLVVSRALLTNFQGPITLNGQEPTVQVNIKALTSPTRWNHDTDVSESSSPCEMRGEQKHSCDVMIEDLPLRSLTPSTIPSDWDAVADIIEPLETLKLSLIEKYPEYAKDETLPGGLPIDIWLKIIILAEDEEGVTTNSQRVNVFEWARSRTALANEIEYLGKAKDAQIRRMLGLIGGLSYDV